MRKGTWSWTAPDLVLLVDVEVTAEELPLDLRVDEELVAEDELDDAANWAM